MDKGTLDDLPGSAPAPQQANAEFFAAKGFIPPLVKVKGPRPANSYRAARRNHVKEHRQLPTWREVTAAYANERANLQGRAAVANGAREAAGKALVEANVRYPGLRHDVVMVSGMLEYYRTLKRTRPVAAIIRSLEREVRSSARG